ncbi:trans-sulfuration enzyme family protein [Amycolatopsis aidingensis]|uniref:trans-sulfuration enzyme family protein n=1 Tax=Amycolatopsis aidingensis TaxID=2842453 RepID=UPI001E55B17A|nr:aminotransferase class I/II-fold pyridoxal phosphate-dependent enzyme [Amycolatopsis aidingensis]
MAVHAGREDLVELGLHAPPLDLSTTYPARDSRAEAAKLTEFAEGGSPAGQPVYARLDNPTVGRFERALAELEGAEQAVAFASGMAALSACLLAIVAAGRPHVVAVRPLYGTSDHLLASGLLGTRVSWASPETLAAQLRPDTGLVLVETPANPTLREHDLRDLATACGEVPLLVDNTFATPVLQRPIECGADLVLHSATKFLGGHGDVLGGIIACREDFARRLRQTRFVTGATLHPLAGYLLLRGLSTLPVRVEAASATAHELATRLAEHPAVRRVHYPGLDPLRPPAQLRGGGPLLAFEVAGDPHAVIGAVRLITPAVSLGSVDSLIQHPASLSHHIVGEQDRNEAGISAGLLRLSVGLEHVEDLWADLAAALETSRKAPAG